MFYEKTQHLKNTIYSIILLKNFRKIFFIIYNIITIIRTFFIIITFVCNYLTIQLYIFYNLIQHFFFYNLKI